MSDLDIGVGIDEDREENVDQKEECDHHVAPARGLRVQGLRLRD